MQPFARTFASSKMTAVLGSDKTRNEGNGNEETETRKWKWETEMRKWKWRNGGNRSKAWRMPLSSLWIEGVVDRVRFTSREARQLHVI